MKQLNLPPCELKTKHEEGNTFIFDIVRKKYVSLTPEEWVRQHFIHLMVNHLKYPRTLISVEFPTRYFKSGKRTDILVNDRSGSPFVLIECKATDVKVDKSAVNQISVYNKTLGSPYIAISNGLSTFIWKFENQKYVSQTQLPPYPF